MPDLATPRLSWRAGRLLPVIVCSVVAMLLSAAACATGGEEGSATALPETETPVPRQTASPTVRLTSSPAPSATAAATAAASVTPGSTASPSPTVTPTATATATPRPTPEPGAALVDIGGGRNLYIRCEGEGDPAVIIEDGWDETGGTWGAFMSLVAETTRVCVYNRAGLGMSDAPPGDGERMAAEVAADLAALTDAHGITGPIVLIGWSGGSLIAQVFTELYPERVAGLVLVDSAHPDAETVWGELGIGPTGDRLDWETLLKDATAAGPFGDLPVRIAAQGGANWSEERQSAWVDLLSDYLALSSNSELTVVPNTGHCVQCDDPQALAEIVTDLVAGIRE